MWWGGWQVAGFLLRPNRAFERQLAAARAALGFERPAVGVHVRNGDYCSFQNDAGGGGGGGGGGHCLMYRHCVCHGFQACRAGPGGSQRAGGRAG